MTARETVDAKARRYLATGRLTVLHRDGDLVLAECAGDGGTYRLGHDPARPGWWHCDCPATRGCAHVTALQLVIVPKSPAIAGDATTIEEPVST